MENLHKIERTLTSLYGERRFLFDARFKGDGRAKPVIVFIHGFKGFKDWGHFNLMADYFARQGFVYIKLNLSHNGTTPENPVAFADLNAFGNNNFSIELDDVGILIDHLFSGKHDIPEAEADLKKLYLMGHSRGGGLAILKAREEPRVKAVVTLAAIHDFKKRWPRDVIEKWKQDGVRYIRNARTGQDMPLYYQLVEDFYRNRLRLDIPEAVKALKQPLLIIHGTADETLPVSMAHEIKAWNPRATLMIIEGTGHTLGGYHPYEQEKLPADTRKAVERTVEFLKEAGR